MLSGKWRQFCLGLNVLNCPWAKLFYLVYNNMLYTAWWKRLLYPQHKKLLGVFRVRSAAPTVLVGSISYLYILSSNFRRCVACKVSCKISKFELTYYIKMGNHGAAGGISERRLSSCSSFLIPAQLPAYSSRNFQVQLLWAFHQFGSYYWSDCISITYTPSWHLHAIYNEAGWVNKCGSSSLLRLITYRVVLVIPEHGQVCLYHYNDVTMDVIVSRITSLAIVYWTFDSDTDQRKHQSSVSLAFREFTVDRWIPRTNGQ